MNLSIVCNKSVLQFSIRTIRNCSDVCSVLFSDLCHCSDTLCTPSLAHNSVHLAVSLLENVLVGQQLVLGMLGAVRPVLELLEVDWAKEEDTSNNSAINPDTGAIKVRHQQLLQLNRGAILKKGGGGFYKRDDCSQHHDKKLSEGCVAV